MFKNIITHNVSQKKKNHQDIISFKIWQQRCVCLFVLISHLDTSDTDYLPAFLLKTW